MIIVVYLLVFFLIVDLNKDIWFMIKARQLKYVCKYGGHFALKMHDIYLITLIDQAKFFFFFGFLVTMLGFGIYFATHVFAVI